MKKRNILVSVIALLALAAIAAALPPPANQSIGFYDTSVNQLTENTCRGCHNSTYLGGVPTRHHDLVPSGEYGCTSCHPVVTGPNGQSVLIDRNCIACHNGSAFYANPSLIAGKPHHNTTLAQVRDCKACHGGFVDNYNDGHYIPLYNISTVTPKTSYQIYNATSGRYWGGCYACHQQDLAATPDILSNANLHHNEILSPTSQVTAGSQCTWCHSTTGTTLSIRKCEDCHSVSTIHNIQYNYTQTNTKAGYGHIGTNWDCNGCHAFWDAGEVPPFGGAIVIDVSSLSPSVLAAGQATVVTLTGDNFVQDAYTTTVKVDGSEITPTTVTNSQLVVPVPALTAGVHQIQAVKTGASGSTTSRLSALTVASQVTIASAKLSSGVITISGTGFGTVDQQYVTIAKSDGRIVYSDSITAWGDASIVAASSTAAVGESVTVTTPTGSATATITAGETVLDSLTVTLPNGGENWKRGTKKTITWDRAGPHQATNVKIELLKGTSVNRVIASNTPNDGTQSWNIPSSQATGTDYKIRITSVGHTPTYTDTSDNNFQISR